MSALGTYETQLVAVGDLNDPKYDGIVLVAAPEQHKTIKEFADLIDSLKQLDAALETEITVIPAPGFNAKRILYAPTGPIDADYDDVRIFRVAANKGIQRAAKAGIEKPLVILIEHPKFEKAQLVTLLGILEGLYVPVQIREHNPQKLHKVESVGVYTKDFKKTEELIKLATILESGRRVACDIGDGDPERMAPPKIESYIKQLFAKTSISVSVISDIKVLTAEYPLFEAVNRASSNIERHQGRIIYLEYNPKETVEKTIFLVGKGVTYDTGGADVKTEGYMAGMSRDKCGAAAAVGFLQIAHLLQPKNIRIVAGLSLVRNSIGSNAYVSDELIKSRSGTLVRIVNTDAEGRMVMADVLCRLREMAIDAVNPHLYTIATLTGHAVLSVGKGYSIVLDNGPARQQNHAQTLQKKGEEISDPFEISVLRKEDIDFIRGIAPGDDVRQCNNESSSKTSRGHQFPAGFLLRVSGLHDHGSASALPLKYSHLDIAASSGHFPEPSTGAPVLALTNAFLLN